MKNWSVGFTVLISLLFSACEKDVDSNPDLLDVVVSSSDKATELLMSLHTRDNSKAMKYPNTHLFERHNHAIADGRQGLIEAMLSGVFDGTTVEVGKTLEDRSLVALHSEYTVKSAPTAGSDDFRFKNGLMAEHWDDLQPLEILDESGLGC